VLGIQWQKDRPGSYSPGVYFLVGETMDKQTSKTLDNEELDNKRNENRVL
jgi:hypothetical protein